MEVNIANIIDTVNHIDDHPEKFLKAEIHNVRMQNILQNVYLFTMHHDAYKTSDILPELIVDMDQEQLWQQLDIRNNHVMPNYLSQVGGVTALREQKLSIQLQKKEKQKILEKRKEENQKIKKNKTLKRSKKSEDNNAPNGDRFFNLEEMNKFLDLEDAKANTKGMDGSGQIDFFQEMDNSNDENDLKYDDFYDNENASGCDDGINDEDVEDTDSGDNENDDEHNGNIHPGLSETENESTKNEVQKSSFEKRQDRRQKQISVHESQLLDEKPWQLKGEVVADGRPQNSLLEEILEFESTVRPAPAITEETTLKLEDIIRQRIKDQAWDDVELKIREKLIPPEYSKQITLNHEKSKMSLSKIYEEEYQQEKDKQNKHIQIEISPETIKIEQNMNNLLDKLNSLFHFFFTPTIVPPEPQIITNTPALQMEDVIPVAVSDANLLAPEEVYKGNKKSLLGNSERTTTDKNRERRKKKLKQLVLMKRSGKQRNDLKSLANSKNTKKVMKSSKAVEMINHADQKQPKSSKQFFARMQENSMTDASNKVIKHKIERAKDVKL